MSVMLLKIIMTISGIIFVASVLLMSPKGGIGMGIGGASWADEYGSKKSLEGKLKNIALVSLIIFVICVIILPYTLKG